MATSLITRETAGAGATVKNAPLTNEEVDLNFISITDNKLEADNNLSDLSSAAAARSNLGVDLTSIDITGGTITGITDLAVDDGGTGASTASAARTNLGLGSISVQDSSSIDITGGTITGITNLEAASGSLSAVVISGGTITGITNLEATGGDLSGVTLSSSDTTITGGSIGSIDSLGVNTAAPTTTGEIRATGDIVSHFSSDIKNKENIVDISDALETVTKIGGKTFDWKDEYINSRGGEDEYFVQKHDFGVIAQEVQDAFPLAVRERENGELAVDYVKLCSLAFAAIKELNEKVDSLITQQRNS